ncbi:cysteine peptidase family C39 domain-containing protein [bacterium]|nr:cysteine peptidase family C39 domain-containing protein [bacterium]
MGKWWLMLLLLAGARDRDSLRFAHIAEQGWDSSCGIGALASLMSRYWGEATDEASLALEFFPERIASGDLTVSFADMAAILRAKGFACAGYRMDYGQLGAALSLHAPVVVHFSLPDGHFALALAQTDCWIIVSDPAEGTLSLSKEDFLSRWSGKALVAAIPGRKADTVFLEEAISATLARRVLLEKFIFRLPGQVAGGSQ